MREKFNKKSEFTNKRSNTSAPTKINQWVMHELSFFSSKDYIRPFYDVNIEAIFTAPDGKTLHMPGFWDGENVWKVRFSATMFGIWTYQIICTDTENTGLHNQRGILQCDIYDGELDIYKHGFIKVAEGGRYFVYQDGTPFFYLGDTHWFMPHERFAASNVIGVDSQFKYIVDKRVAQNFTVYQSEPIMVEHIGDDEEAVYDLTSFDQNDLKGFWNLDRKFQYIADCGMVHANAELVFSACMAGKAFTLEYIKKLVRYWVARYSAYPVLWTTAQEVDAYGYGFQSPDEPAENYKNWVLVAELTYEMDPYKHPITAHMGCKVKESTFHTLPCHSWFGLQWSYERNEEFPFDDFKEQWAYTTKPIVLYEGRYDGYWETNYTWTRSQGYTSWLLGMYGHGYGVNGIWNDIYHKNDVGCAMSGREGWIEQSWYEGANSPGGEYMQLMAKFFSTLDWWKLIPRFDDQNWFSPEEGCFYVLASDSGDTFVAYLYNETQTAGTIGNMYPKHEYTVKWYDIRTGEYIDSGTQRASEDGRMKIIKKPDEKDWILLVQEKSNIK